MNNPNVRNILAYALAGIEFFPKNTGRHAKGV
jgi:hypothetical protein